MHVHSRRDALRLLGLAAVSSLGSSGTAVGGDQIPLAIKGYDPVAYFTLGAATPGSPEIEYEWDEYRYRFARQEHRELFEANPERYAPQFKNFCAMALALGSLFEADPESWMISDGKLYVFGSIEGRDRFQQNLTENTERANQNRAQIEQRR